MNQQTALCGHGNGLLCTACGTSTPISVPKKRKALDSLSESLDTISISEEDSDFNPLEHFERRLESFFQIEAPLIVEKTTISHLNAKLQNTPSQRDCTQFPKLHPQSIRKRAI